jgi:hypothetical protein
MAPGQTGSGPSGLSIMGRSSVPGAAGGAPVVYCGVVACMSRSFQSAIGPPALSGVA